MDNNNDKKVSEMTLSELRQIIREECLTLIVLDNDAKQLLAADKGLDSNETPRLMEFFQYIRSFTSDERTLRVLIQSWTQMKVQKQNKSNN